MSNAISVLFQTFDVFVLYTSTSTSEVKYVFNIETSAVKFKRYLKMDSNFLYVPVILFKHP